MFSLYFSGFAKFLYFDILNQGLDAIEHTNMRYLTREMTAEFYALKGMLLAHLSK